MNFNRIKSMFFFILFLNCQLSAQSDIELLIGHLRTYVGMIHYDGETFFVGEVENLGNNKLKLISSSRYPNTDELILDISKINPNSIKKQRVRYIEDGKFKFWYYLLRFTGSGVIYEENRYSDNKYYYNVELCMAGKTFVRPTTYDENDCNDLERYIRACIPIKISEEEQAEKAADGLMKFYKNSRESGAADRLFEMAREYGIEAKGEAYFHNDDELFSALKEIITSGKNIIIYESNLSRGEKIVHTSSPSRFSTAILWGLRSTIDPLKISKDVEVHIRYEVLNTEKDELVYSKKRIYPNSTDRKGFIVFGQLFDEKDRNDYPAGSYSIRFWINGNFIGNVTFRVI